MFLLQAVIVAFIMVVTVAGYLIYARFDGQSKHERMMARIAGNTGTVSGVSGESFKDRQLAKHRAEIAKKLKEAGKENGGKKKKGSSLREKIQQAGLDITVPQFLIASGVSGVIFTLIALMIPMNAILKLSLIAIGFIGFPRYVLSFRAARRQKKFLTDFADALDAMVRLLQAGMPVTEAIAMVSREYTGPVREEMARIYDDQKVGIRLGEAAERAAKRMPLTEVKMFATAVQIQSETGSSLSEVLTNLSGVIRARFKLQRKVKALSSEAKSSAAIIAALPVVVTLGLYAVNPEYISLLFTTGTGKILSTGAVIWMAIGVFIMKQMINFRV